MLEPREVERWQRLTAAMIRKAGQDDPEALAQVLAILDTVPGLLRDAVAELRNPDKAITTGQLCCYSWADIARPLGITRSAAQQRFGHGRADLLNTGAGRDMGTQRRGE